MATEHVNYPHFPGRLYDCPACESACHCTPGETECVFEGEHNGSAAPDPDAPAPAPVILDTLGTDPAGRPRLIGGAP